MARSAAWTGLSLKNIAMAVGYSVRLPLLLWFGDGGADYHSVCSGGSRRAIRRRIERGGMGRLQPALWLGV
jgi:hypothetical protein